MYLKCHKYWHLWAEQNFLFAFSGWWNQGAEWNANRGWRNVPGQRKGDCRPSEEAVRGQVTQRGRGEW